MALPAAVILLVSEALPLINPAKTLSVPLARLAITPPRARNIRPLLVEPPAGLFPTTTSPPNVALPAEVIEAFTVPFSEA